MSNPKIKTLVNQQTSFELDPEKLADINAIADGEGMFHVLHDKKAYRFELISKDLNDRNYTFRIGGNTYSVDIKNELDDLIEKMGYQIGASKTSNSVVAPMPGIVLEVLVRAGEAISEDQPLLILEAMKMENALLSPKNGLIKSVHVESGETVDKNKLLIELED